ncbi:hypothetical protein BDV18DRAFT_142321 [Aspergillus unguis]
MRSLSKRPSVDAITNSTNTTTKLEPRPLLTLPPELLLEIFQFAPSLEDAAHFAATSKQLYAVWQQHLTRIYNQVAPASIPAHSALRGLLVDLGHITLKPKHITVEYISHIVKGSRIGADLVKKYLAAEDSNENQDPQVSIQLSSSEERRFIRAMFQILGLLSLEKRKQEKRVKHLDLKTQFLLSDFLCVFNPYNIEDPALRVFLDNDPQAYRYLQRDLRSRRNKKFHQLYNTYYRPILNTPYENGGRFAWWCDRQQDMLRDMLTGRVFQKTDDQVVKPKVHDDEWYDSAEE